MASTDYTRLQSQTINVLRFPLALGVVFIHMTPATVAPIDASFPLASPQGIYNLILIVTSHVIPVVAVPLFFFISGLLFFLNFDGASFDGYRKKLKSRFSSMLVPYLLWNVIAFLPILAVNIASAILHGQPSGYLTEFFHKYSWHTFYDVYSLGDITTFFGHTFRDGAPIIIPLWFLRDLIIVSICTPLIFRAIKFGGIILPAVLFICTTLNIRFPIPGPAVSSFFWFSAGAYFSIKGLNVIEFTDKYKGVIIPASIAALIVLTAVDTWFSVPGPYLTPLCTIPLILLCFIISSYLIEKHGATASPLLVGSCFFIYAFHLMDFPYIGTPVGFIRHILSGLMPASSLAIKTIIHIITPLLTIGLCIGLYCISGRVLPKTTKILSGNR